MTGFVAGLKILLITLPQVWQANGPYGGITMAAALDPSGNPTIYTSEGFFRKITNQDWERIDPYTPLPFSVDWMNEIALAYGRIWAAPRQEGLWWRSEAAAGWNRATGLPNKADVVGMVALSDTMVVATAANGLWVSYNKGDNFQLWENPGTITAIAAVERYIALALGNRRVIRIWRPVMGWREETIPSYVPVPVTSLTWAISGGVYYLHVGTTNGVTYVRNPQFDIPLGWKGDMGFSGATVTDLLSQDIDIIAATSDGIRHSTDNGEGWSTMNSGLHSFTIFDLVGSNAATIFASSLTGLYKLSGTQWVFQDKLPAQAITGIELNPLAPRQLTVSSFGSGGFTSTEAGKFWDRTGTNEIPLNLGFASGKIGIGKLFYAALYDAIAVSPDSGKTWPDTLRFSIPDARGNPSSVILVECNPKGDKEVWFVTRGRNSADTDNQYQLWFSSDILATRRVIGDLGANAVSDLVVSPDGNLVYVSTPLGVYRSDTPRQANSLSPAQSDGLPAGTYLQQLESAQDRLYGCSNQGEVFSSDNRADNWSKALGLDGIFIEGIVAEPELTNFLIAANAFDKGLGGFSVFASVDGGKTWDRRTQIVPGDARGAAVRVVDSLFHAYLATTEGVFYDTFTITKEPVVETLQVTITAEQGSFFPEVNEEARFFLGGEDFARLTSWQVQVSRVLDDEIVFTKTGDAAQSELVWDGYDTDGFVSKSGQYRAVFNAASDGAQGADTAFLELVIGTPPRSNIKEATESGLLLHQDGRKGALIYRGRIAPELFKVTYDATTQSFTEGRALSASRDFPTEMPCIVSDSDGTYWYAWVEDRAHIVVTDNQDYILDTAFSNPGIKYQALTISASGEVVLAFVYNDGGTHRGRVYFLDNGSWLEDTVFLESSTIGDVEDFGALGANDGVHIFYVADGVLHDVIWLGAGQGVDTTKDPKFAGVKEFAATSRGDDKIYLAFADNGGRLLSMERSQGDWSEPQELPKGSQAAPVHLTANTREDGVLTFAWEAASAIYYLQRTSGSWGEPVLKTPQGSAFFPQMSQTTSAGEEPLIAWTEGSAPPYFVRVTSLTAAPPQDSLVLTLSAPGEIFRGDTIEIGVKADTICDKIDVSIQHIESEQTFMPDYRFPGEDSISYDTLYASYYNTTTLPEGAYLILTEAHSGFLEAMLQDTLIIGTRHDELLDPSNVFFVPSPAVQQQSGRVYYTLNFEADVSLEIFTARARRISHYDAGTVSPGIRNYFEVDIGGLGSDVYFFRLVADADPDGDGVPLSPEMPSESDTYVVVTKPFVVVR